MAEGFIVRRGGGEAKQMKVIEISIMSNPSVLNAITDDRLIGCKAFYIFALNLAPNNPRIQSVLYLDGNSTTIISQGIIVSNAQKAMFTQEVNNVQFDSSTGTVIVNDAIFYQGADYTGYEYTCWAYVEEG